MPYKITNISRFHKLLGLYPKESKIVENLNNISNLDDLQNKQMIIIEKIIESKKKKEEVKIVKQEENSTNIILEEKGEIQ